ncbi:MAG: helix-turn-helix domain-containing protein [Roseburia sp.]|nr:helix-turn-helix domain-containing protein [Roseburia sp.]MCM1097421.1 helix-turn-helix domain-containing protein [Ruminococcus flavefaciens]
MVDLEKVGKRISQLRKAQGYTGEALAERLGVSPQAVSKWENGRCLPEASILPGLARALDCSIDSLLCPRELFVLKAVYTDGQTHIPVTQFVNDMVRDNVLSVYVNESFLGISLETGRLKVLTIKYQTPEGVFFSYALQGNSLILSRENSYTPNYRSLKIIDAYYGNDKDFSSAMQKIKHYEYFRWNKIPVNQETFPSSTASDETEYLTLIYLNADGIHVLSCPENEAVYYGDHRTNLYLEDRSMCFLKGVERLSWGEGMECPWAGALYAALKYMREPYPYYQIMGRSGACWRICFTDVWDYSCTDALVAYDYVTPFFQSIGYSFRMADRVEKRGRKQERLAVMEDIQKGKPVLAINLRVAPEWGVITGYTENGDRFLCRTYFDKGILDALEQGTAENPEDRRMVFEENGGYLFNDFWPFLLLHFGEKGNALSPREAFKMSLTTLVSSFEAKESRGYYQGKEAYEAWMRGLEREADFSLESDRENVLRRLSVNDSMLCSLADARKAAAVYLRESSSAALEDEKENLEKIASNCQTIADMIFEFREKTKRESSCALTYNTVSGFGASLPRLRREQVALLKRALALEEENCRQAKQLLAKDPVNIE